MYARKLMVLGSGLLLVAVIFACATAAPPSELVEAQQEFEKASNSPTATVNPKGLLQAKKALDRANQEFKEHPNAASTRDFAYVALRRAQLAEVQADTLIAAQQKTEAERQMKEQKAQHQAQVLRQTEQELRNTQQQLAESGQQAQTIEQLHQERDLARAQQDLADKNSQVESGRRTAMRSSPEQQQLSAKLANIAPVRREPRGIVIAFPESALFANGRSTLKPSAKSKLNQVAAALADGEEKIVIEGHTDAIGSNRQNTGLSERRAITVRDYLRDRGISPDRMTAVGFGGTRPLASESTPKGRAKNRRVEIVVQLPPALSAG